MSDETKETKAEKPKAEETKPKAEKPKAEEPKAEEPKAEKPAVTNPNKELQNLKAELKSAQERLAKAKAENSKLAEEVEKVNSSRAKMEDKLESAVLVDPDNFGKPDRWKMIDRVKRKNCQVTTWAYEITKLGCVVSTSMEWTGRGTETENSLVFVPESRIEEETNEKGEVVAREIVLYR